MNNAIFLYKLPYVYGGVTQPYFMSDTIRDNWLYGYTATQVNGNGVSIKFLYNYELEVVVDVDFTQINNFNFAVIRYNGKRYFANIIDSELVSVNKCRLMLLRNPIFEHTNFLEHFTDLKIRTATFKDLFYSNNAKYMLKRDFRYYSRKRELSFVNGDIMFIECALLYLSNIPQLQEVFSFSCHGICSNYGLLFKPIAEDFKDKVDYLYGNEYYFTDGLHVRSAFQLSNLWGEITRLAPYCAGYEFLRIPCKIVSKQIESGNDSSGNTVYKTVKCFQPLFITQWRQFEGDTSIGANGLYYIAEGEVLTYDYSSNKLDDMYIISKIYIMSSENVLEIDHKNYAYGGQISYRIQFKYCFSMIGTDIVCSVTGFDGSVLGNFQKNEIFPLRATTSYALDSSQLFQAQNRYYNTLTKNTQDEIGTKALISSVAQFGAGGAELTAHNFVGGNMSQGSFALGVGNMIRGIGSAATGVADIAFYANERAILAQQEMEKPSTNLKCSNSSSVSSEYSFQILCEEKVPFEIDLSNFKHDAYNYGIDCYITEDTFDFKRHTVNNFFYLSAIGTLKHPSTLTTREYSELYSYLKNGCRYEIIPE